MTIVIKLTILMLLILILMGILFILKRETFLGNSPIDIWVINLDKDSTRIITFKKNLERNENSDLNMMRYPAILGKNVKKTDPLYKKYINTTFNAPFNHDATIGCVISHASLYNKLHQTYKNDVLKKFFIICEDDAIITKHFSNKLNTILNELPNDWDFVYLGSSQPYGTKYSKHLLKPTFKNGNWGFFGYMLSKRGLDKVVKHCINIDKPIDNFLKYKDLNYFICNPFLITHDFDNISNLTGKNRKHETNEYNKIVINSNPN
jgi:GR25 family glycosyltransferase involved in LPS biosynthesis